MSSQILAKSSSEKTILANRAFIPIYKKTVQEFSAFMHWEEGLSTGTWIGYLGILKKFASNTINRGNRKTLGLSVR